MSLSVFTMPERLCDLSLLVTAQATHAHFERDLGGEFALPYSERKKLNRWGSRYLQVTCPECHAGIGRRCHRALPWPMNLRLTRYVHKGRLTRYRLKRGIGGVA